MLVYVLKMIEPEILDKIIKTFGTLFFRGIMSWVLRRGIPIFRKLSDARRGHCALFSTSVRRVQVSVAGSLIFLLVPHKWTKDSYF